MPDGFDVRPEQLRRGAADLRDDAGRLGDAASDAGAAVDQVTHAAGPGRVAAAAADFSLQLDGAMRAIHASLLDCASALETASTQYLVGDDHVSSTLTGGAVPGVGRPV
jgi:hypothetical protein